MSAVAQPILDESIISTVMRQYGTKHYVCSFHSMPMKTTRAYRTRAWNGPDGKLTGSPWTEYNLDAVFDPKERPSVCVIMDGMERVFVGTDEVSFKKRYENRPESSINIANDIVKFASGALPSGPMDYSHPAVWITECNSESGKAFPKTTTDRFGRTIYSSDWDLWGKPEFAKKYPEFARECAQYLERQWHYCEIQVLEGDGFWNDQDRNKRKNVNERHRNSAAFIGKTPAQHEWIQSSTWQGMKACPFCGKPTSPEHPKCNNCGEIINQAMYDARKMEIQTAPAAK